MELLRVDSKTIQTIVHCYLRFWFHIWLASCFNVQNKSIKMGFYWIFMFLIDPKDINCSLICSFPLHPFNTVLVSCKKEDLSVFFCVFEVIAWDAEGKFEDFDWLTKKDERRRCKKGIRTFWCIKLNFSNLALEVTKTLQIQFRVSQKLNLNASKFIACSYKSIFSSIKCASTPSQFHQTSKLLRAFSVCSFIVSFIFTIFWCVYINFIRSHRCSIKKSFLFFFSYSNAVLFPLYRHLLVVWIHIQSYSRSKHLLNRERQVENWNEIKNVFSGCDTGRRRKVRS